MSDRKHISWKTKYASALLALGDIPYSDAKLMTEDQIISLYQLDHNILHETELPERDSFWNLEPKLIHVHRAKTRADAKIIAKGRRIRKKNAAASAPTLRTGPDELGMPAYGALAAAPRPARLAAVIRVWKRNGPFMQKRKLQSRGFDKTRRRKMDGTVVKR